MARIIEISDINAPELRPYVSLTGAQLRSRLDPRQALIVVESPKVIAVALDRGFRPVSMLCEGRHIAGDASALLERCPADMPVYTAERDTLARLTGYALTRGVLCAMQRPAEPSAEAITHGAKRVAVIDAVTDTTNIGAIFRSAAALGIDAVLLTRTACDPFNRRSIRVSMGSVFLVPWAWLEGDTIAELHRLGLTTAAMALTDRSVSIRDPRLQAIERLAIIMGTEGDGLAPAVIEASDYVVKIPMSHNVDSLNVAAASAVAFYQLVGADMNQ